jgi:hypothetical protein
MILYGCSSVVGGLTGALFLHPKSSKKKRELQILKILFFAIEEDCVLHLPQLYNKLLANYYLWGDNGALIGGDFLIATRSPAPPPPFFLH